MKILIATAVYYPMVNGVAVFSHNLAVGLARRGHEVLVLCPSQTGKNYEMLEDGVRVKYLKSVQVKVYPDQIHAVPEGKKWSWYQHGFRVSVFPEREVRQVMQEFCPDVVHVQVSDMIGVSVMRYAKKLGIPVVMTEHNQPEVLTDPLKLPKLMKAPANVMLSSYLRNRQSKSDFVTMPTKQAILHLLEQRECPVPVAAVSNGVDLAHFVPGEADAEIYTKYGISRDALVVLYIGRLDPEKQVGRVMEAFALAQQKMTNADDLAERSGQKKEGRLQEKKPKKIELVIVGDGVDKVRLVKKTKRMNLEKTVKFTGKVLPPELYELYRVGTIFVTASEIETQGIVLIEAAAMGLPLIAVDKGAVAEVCRNGENGLLCQAGNVAEMAEAMVTLLTDTEMRSKFSAKSLEVAREHDLERTLDQFINIYQRVVKRQRFD